MPTRDYYAIQAVFATTQLAERPAPFLPMENMSGFDERQHLLKRHAEHLAELARLDEKLLANAQAWFSQNKKDSAKWNAAVEEARGTPRKNPRREFADVFSAARNALTRQGVPEDEFPPKLVGFVPEDYGNERVARKGLERLRWELTRYEPLAVAVYSGHTPARDNVYAPLATLEGRRRVFSTPTPNLSPTSSPPIATPAPEPLPMCASCSSTRTSSPMSIESNNPMDSRLVVRQK